MAERYAMEMKWGWGVDGMGIALNAKLGRVGMGLQDACQWLGTQI